VCVGGIIYPPEVINQSRTFPAPLQTIHLTTEKLLYEVSYESNVDFLDFLFI